MDLMFTTLTGSPVSDSEDIQILGCNSRVSSGSEYDGSVVTKEHFSQDKLSDLIRDLSLPNKAAELLAS